MIITVTNQKGGVGKTTLSLHIAAEFALSGFQTKLIDTDPQHSALDWTAQRDALDLDPLFELEAWPKDTLHKHIESKASGYDVVIIDVPPQVESHCRSAVIVADMILVPLNASPFDLWAASATIETIRAARQFKPDIDAAFVLNSIDPRIVLTRETSAALEEYEDMDLLNTRVCRRVDFAYALAEGKVVQEYAPSSKARREIRQLVQELRQRKSLARAA
jgi:chromosome partitioning protein